MIATPNIYNVKPVAPDDESRRAFENIQTNFINVFYWASSLTASLSQLATSLAGITVTTTTIHGNDKHSKTFLYATPVHDNTYHSTQFLATTPHDNTYHASEFLYATPVHDNTYHSTQFLATTPHDNTYHASEFLYATPTHDNTYHSSEYLVSSLLAASPPIYLDGATSLLYYTATNLKQELSSSGYPASCIFWSKLENTTAEIGNNLYAAGSITHVAAKFNNGLKVTSSAYLVLTPDTNLNGITTRGSLCFWYKSEGALKEGGRFICTGGDNVQMQIYENNGKTWFWMNDGTHNPSCYFDNSLINTAGELHFLQFAWDMADTPQLKIYIDGVATYTTYSSGVISGSSWGENKFYLMNFVPNTALYQNGIMDNLAFFQYPDMISSSVYNEENYGGATSYYYLNTIQDISTDSNPQFVSLTASLCKITPEGGYAVRLKNFTGATTIMGELVTTSATDDAFILTDGYPDCMGVVYESGITGTNYAWVVVAGIADVMLNDGDWATSGYWAKVSATAGRALVTTAPADIGALAASEYYYGIGHCIQTTASGTSQLTKLVLQFN